MRKENYGNTSIEINYQDFDLIDKSHFYVISLILYSAKAKLIIELDGSQHYEPDYQEKDALRDAELNSLGFTVMRFSNDEVMREIEAVVEQIYLFLENVRAD